MMSRRSRNRREARSPGYSLTSASSCGARTRWRRARTATTRSTIACRRSRRTTQERRLHADRQFLLRLHAIERDELDARDRISYDLFEFMVSQRVTLARYQEWRTPLNSDSGFHSDVLYMDELTTPQTVADYERFIARLARCAAFLRRACRQHADRHARRLYVARGDSGRRIEGHRQRAIRRCTENAAVAAVREVFARGARSGARAPGGRGQGRARQRGDARVCRVPAFLRKRVSPGCAGDDRCVSASGWQGLLRRPGSLFHDASRCDAGKDPRGRGGGGCAPSRGDGGDPSRRESRRQLCRLRRLPARRSAVLRENDGGAAARSRVDREGNRRQAAGVLRHVAAHALCGQARAGGAGAELHRRALQPGTDRRRRRVLGEHVRAPHSAALCPALADAARGRARASPAMRAGARASRPAAISL